MKHLLVIGQGPAGVSAAVYAKRGGAAVTVVANGVGALEKAEQIDTTLFRSKRRKGLKTITASASR